MKQIDGIQALKELLKIQKKISKKEDILSDTEIFNDDFIVHFNFGFDISDIIKRLIKCPKETILPIDDKEMQEIMKRPDYVCNDWVDDVVYDYCYNKINLNEALNKLLYEEDKK